MIIISYELRNKNQNNILRVLLNNNSIPGIPAYILGLEFIKV